MKRLALLSIFLALPLFSLGQAAPNLSNIYAAGISFNGTNTGWQWNAGALASIKLKNNWFVMPNVRLLKSSVSNGAGYQPIVGVLFGWGQ